MELLNNYWSAQTIYFSVAFLAILLLSVKWRQKARAFSVDSANELRGLAILGVIFAHIGYGMYYGTDYLFPLAIWGGVAVNLFFFASGFGLTASAFRKDLSVKDFYWRRLTKIVIPVWLTLTAFIAIDAIFLKRFYNWTEIWQSYLLFFPKADLFQSINSPLWFITPLVFFYLIFPIIFKKSKPVLSAVLFFAFSFLLTLNFWPISEQINSFYDTHFLAFPLGVLMAVIFNRFSPSQESKKILQMFARIFKNQKLREVVKNNYYWWIKKKDFAIAVLLLLLASLAYYTALYSGIGQGHWVEQSISLITTMSLVLIFIFKPIEFRLLRFIGDNSFEIYLLHWPLLYRYGFLIDSIGPWLGAIIGIALVVLLAYFFKLFNKQLEKRWF
jgi:peptidoglycan/LPS O-acetylase OafA/YrhL